MFNDILFWNTSTVSERVLTPKTEEISTESGVASTVFGVVFPEDEWEILHEGHTSSEGSPQS